MTEIVISKTGKWTKAAADLELASTQFRPAVMKALVQEGEFLANKMRGTIRSGDFAAHSPLTMIIRHASGRGGGSKILIQSSNMINSVKVVRSGLGVFVGVKAGSPSANIAAIHEGGAAWTQRMTPRQRRFLFAMFDKGGQPTEKSASSGGLQIRIKIPARPFVSPTADLFGGVKFQSRFNRRLGRLLSGAIGS